MGKGVSAATLLSPKHRAWKALLSGTHLWLCESWHILLSNSPPRLGNLNPAGWRSAIGDDLGDE